MKDDLVNVSQLKQRILKGITDQKDFESLALTIFKYQLDHNVVYQDFIRNLNIDVDQVRSIDDIPHLPIDAFKYHQVSSQPTEVPALIFESSGTGQGLKSKHQVYDLDFYLDNARAIFESAYGSLGTYSLMAYLPSYHQQKTSSLLYMVQDFISHASIVGSGFYIDREEELLAQLLLNQSAGIKTILIGVSYALLDLAETRGMDLSKVIVMETGGMKGRREELNRQELHAILQTQFNLKAVHSEYGMTELMSQAYSKGEGLFELPRTMHLSFKELTDPFCSVRSGKVGTINIIDLANFDSCAFIATQDLGRDMGARSFKVEGRLDHADIRGCSLLYTG